MSDLYRLWRLFRYDLAVAGMVILFMFTVFWSMDQVAAALQAGY